MCEWQLLVIQEVKNANSTIGSTVQLQRSTGFVIIPRLRRSPSSEAITPGNTSTLVRRLRGRGFRRTSARRIIAWSCLMVRYNAY